MEPIIQLNNVSKSYGIGGPRQVDAVKDVSLFIETGKVTAFGGPSGSGKTTLLSMIGLLTKPTTGEILVRDDDISALSEVYRTKVRRELIGFVFQAQYLIPQLTAVENVALPMVCTDMSRGEAERIATEKLVTLGMKHRLQFRVAELSGGEQQRVSIARSLMNEPEILIADEPSSSIDNELTQELLGILRIMVEKNNLTVIAASHDSRVLEWADIVYTMQDGTLNDS